MYTIIIHFTDGTVEAYDNQNMDFANSFLTGKCPHLMCSTGSDNDDAVIIPAHMIKKIEINKAS